MRKRVRGGSSQHWCHQDFMNYWHVQTVGKCFIINPNIAYVNCTRVKHAVKDDPTSNRDKI